MEQILNKLVEAKNLIDEKGDSYEVMMAKVKILEAIFWLNSGQGKDSHWDPKNIETITTHTKHHPNRLKKMYEDLPDFLKPKNK
jgi:hypothetical protein